MELASGVRLSERNVSLSALYLDPNNIRYAALDVVPQVPDSKVRDEPVQRKALERILTEQFDVRQLKRSIQTSGFLPVDRLIAVELPPDGSEQFVVVEGNRRVAAMKSLLEDEAGGEITLEPSVRSTIETVPIIVVEGEDREARWRTAHMLQGVRHVSSVKDWVPYAKAQLIPIMEADGKSLKEIREALGLTAQAMNVFRRVLAAMNQMRQHGEYGDLVRPRLWGHFEEALKNAEIRRWLDWDDESLRVANEENAELFYSWIVGAAEDGERLPPKVPEAKAFRHLPAVLGDASALRRFKEDPRLTVDDARNLVGVKEPAVDWRLILRENAQLMQQVPAVQLAGASDEDRELVGLLKELCDQLLRHMDVSPKK